MTASPAQHPLEARFDPSEIERSIPWRFERQVDAFPDRPALVGSSTRETYREIESDANRIARALLGACGEAQGRVVIFLDQGTLFVKAILGVLKAGKAYVPVDPAFPRARNEHIVVDSQPELVLTHRRHLAHARDLAGAGVPILDLSALDPAGDDSRPGVEVGPDALAYIVYTSGSTGRPKGVMQTHRNVLHGCMRRTKLQEIGPDDRMTLLYSCSVMGATHGIFCSLLNGASLHPYDVRKRGLSHLAEWIDEREITIYHSVASLFRHFLAQHESGTRLPSVRMVILGGERVLTEDVRRARQVFSDHCRLMTGLGTTENGTVRVFPIDAHTPLDSEIVPLGHAVEGMEIVLIDEDGRAIAPGGVGEIGIRSRYNSPGYWNLPDVTRKAFLPDPADPRITLYRTGDMGFLRPDGVLEHRGRRDFQVKIRGFRVEIGEVEAALAAHPAVVEGAVLLRRVGGEERLVAYWVARGGAEAGERPAAHELRAFLRGRLPHHMVPALFVRLDAMPTTPNGKLDRRALPEPEATEGAAEDATSPRNDTEAALAKIWSQVLERSVGVRDDFLDLGGHSLLAVRIVDRIEAVLGRRLPAAALFHCRTVEQIARVVRGEAPAEGRPVVPLQPSGSRPPFFFLAGRSHFGDALGADQPAYRVVYQDLDRDEVFVQVEDMAAHSLEALRSVQASGPYFLGGHGLGGLVAFEMAQRLTREGDTVAALVLCECRAPGFLPRHGGPWKRAWIRVRHYARETRRRGTVREIRRLLGIAWSDGLRLFWRNSSIARSLSRKRSRQVYGAAVLESRRRYDAAQWAGPLSVVRSSERPPWRDQDPLDGWGRFAPRARAHKVPGTHTSIYRPPQVQALAKVLNEILGQARQDEERARRDRR